MTIHISSLAKLGAASTNSDGEYQPLQNTESCNDRAPPCLGI